MGVVAQFLRSVEPSQVGILGQNRTKILARIGRTVVIFADFLDRRNDNASTVGAQKNEKIDFSVRKQKKYIFLTHVL